MRYYVKTLSGEKGPYELDEIRESLRAGRLRRDVLLRPEDDTKTIALEELVPHEGTPSASQEGTRRRRRVPGDVYAPPEEYDDANGPDSVVQADPGSFGTGFIVGFFCGCFGLVWALVSKEIRPETKRGVFVGFGVGLVVGGLVRVMAAASNRRF